MINARVFCAGILLAACGARLAGSATAAGHPATQSELVTRGRALEHGTGVAKDLTGAAALFDQACKRGDFRGCSYLSQMTYSGDGVAKDPARARALAEEACTGGDALGCGILGASYRLHEPQDLSLAKTFEEKACDGGDAPSCDSLAEAYNSGDGVSVDGTRATAYETRAATLYASACESKDMEACSWLGEHYRGGGGVPKDAARARYLFDTACAGNNIHGCETLAELYERGEGVPKNEARSNELLEKACALGETDDCRKPSPSPVPASNQCVITLVQGMRGECPGQGCELGYCVDVPVSGSPADTMDTCRDQDGDATEVFVGCCGRIGGRVAWVADGAAAPVGNERGCP